MVEWKGKGNQFAVAMKTGKISICGKIWGGEMA